VEKFVHRENVALYMKHLLEPHTDAERKVLLADEEAKGAPSSRKT
jgi:hypothetical protein